MSKQTPESTSESEPSKILKSFLKQHADKLWNLKPPDIDVSKAEAAINTHVQKEVLAELNSLLNRKDDKWTLQALVDRVAELEQLIKQSGGRT